MGARYARLLELLWKPRSSASIASSERRRNELSIASLASNSPMSPERAGTGAARYSHQSHSPQQQQQQQAQHHQNHHGQQRHQASHAHQYQQSAHFDPANDFSWLDLGAVGDYVSGDQMATGLMDFDSGLQDGSGMYPGQQPQNQQQAQIWPAPFWPGDSMSTSLYF